MFSKRSEFLVSMESVPRLNNIGCFSLKNGCIFLGLLLIVYSVISIIQSVVMILMTLLDFYPEPEQSVEGLITSMLLIIAVGLVHCITLLLTMTMVVGVIRDKCHLIKPWIVWTSCQVLFGLLLFVFWTANNLVNHTGSSLIVYLVYFIILVTRFYMLMVICSHYKELEEVSTNDRLARAMNSEFRYGTV